MREMFLPLKVSATALEAQKVRLNTIASNVANASSTKSTDGGPYKRKDVQFQSVMYDESSVGVDIPKIVEDQRPPRIVFDPSHPDADKNGYVSYPNINVIEEMVNLLAASRAYEANLTLMSTYKEMYMKTLSITSV
jgi:flagellar basal-body rod protein FlgC